MHRMAGEVALVLKRKQAVKQILYGGSERVLDKISGAGRGGMDEDDCGMGYLFLIAF